MEQKPNPIYQRGERNIYCPFYNDCLDYAVNHFWRHWSCSQCPYRNIKSINEFEYGANGERIEYELSPDIIRKIGENASG
jgi:hypothetical protein